MSPPRSEGCAACRRDIPLKTLNSERDVRTVSAIKSRADKELRTFRAQLALAGWVMHIVGIENDRASVWVSRWGRSVTLSGQHELVQFIQQAGVA